MISYLGIFLLHFFLRKSKSLSYTHLRVDDSTVDVDQIEESNYTDQGQEADDEYENTGDENENAGDENENAGEYEANTSQHYDDQEYPNEYLDGDVNYYQYDETSINQPEDQPDQKQTADGCEPVIPNSNYHEVEQERGSTLDTGKQLSYAQVVKEGEHQLELASLPLCPFAIENDECPYREKCNYLHGDRCEYCDRLCLHPHNKESRKRHHEVRR